MNPTTNQARTRLSAFCACPLPELVPVIPISARQCRSMDFDWNVGAEQRDRSEGSQPDASSEVEKIRSAENEEGEQNRGIASSGSNGSLKNTASWNFLQNQWENHFKMCDRGRDTVYQPNFDGNAVGFAGEDLWLPKVADLGYNNYEEAKETNERYRNCKSGINISVVSRQETPSENGGVEKPMYSVSFKRCYDNRNPKWDNKRRRFFSSYSNKSKKSKKHGNSPSNYRGTFENCCGNCEPYVVEIQSNDCGSCRNWQSTDFETKTACFEDCCWRGDASNVRVAPQRPCVENATCCAPANEPNCDFLREERAAAPSKHCLQRVHFAKADNCAKTNCSACSFCSRKCTPSKASLFVEIGESVGDVCNLTSARALQCDESMESLKGDAVRTGSSVGKRRKSDLLRGRSKSKKNEPRCSSSCKGRPSAVERGYSDGIASEHVHGDNCAIEQVPQEAFCPGMLEATSLQELRDCRAQTESDMYLKKSTAGCSQQCETDERSLLDDIRKGKVWSQLQDTYRSFVKVAATSIGQIVKQSSKLKRSKKCPKKQCGTCTKGCEMNVARADQCNQSESCNECTHEGTHWKGVTAHESNNCDTHCCRNVCYDNCQTSVCSYHQLCLSTPNNYWKPNSNTAEQIQSERDWHLDPSNEAPSQDPRQATHGGVRKRGGGDSPNQKKKSSRRPNPGEQSGSSNNRDNPDSRNQITSQQTEPFLPHDGETERATVHIDVSVQASAIRAAVEPSSPYIAESMTYQKRVKTIKRLESPKKRDSLVIQEIDSSSHAIPHKEESKVSRRPVAQPPRRAVPTPVASRRVPRAARPEISSRIVTSSRRELTQRDRPDKTTTPDRIIAKSPMMGRPVQCTILTDNRYVCGSDFRETSIQVEKLCTCPPSTAMLRSAVEEKPTIEPIKENDEPVVEDTPEEAAPESAATVETPVETDDATKEVPTVGDIKEEAEQTVDTQEDASAAEGTEAELPSMIETPEETLDAPTEESMTPMPDSLTTTEPVADKPTEEPEETPDSQTLATTVNDVSTPIEFSREFNGKRTYVSVQMQTSNTILTQILSEFQIGNKKRQVLMSIRLQSNLDGSGQGTQQSPEASGSEV
ncbi:uncharacterized protein LOC143433455 [Xylocopa sonorina]|uniref:uncharacterized protein LOC143433455 n=1 Tax=Xylocopa sonorina TaxID=1818115 RepID=UPI00403A9E82